MNSYKIHVKIKLAADEDTVIVTAKDEDEAKQKAECAIDNYIQNYFILTLLLNTSLIAIKPLSYRAFLPTLLVLFKKPSTISNNIQRPKKPLILFINPVCFHPILKKVLKHSFGKVA